MELDVASFLQPRRDPLCPDNRHYIETASMSMSMDLTGPDLTGLDLAWLVLMHRAKKARRQKLESLLIVEGEGGVI
jgi:hypothetical protein